MTDTDKAKALDILTTTEMVTGMDLSTVKWGVSRQQTDTEEPQDQDTNQPAEEEG